MNYPQIAAAELLENQADRLFLYCWSVLRSRETAQIALRDTLLAASADASGTRLYSLARAECGRHRAVPAADADEAPVCLGRNDADNRLVAWNAAMSLEPAEFEALELSTRHTVDLGQVLGRPADQAQALLARARQNLERAVGAEVLARRGHPCPDRAEVLAGWSGTMTPELRDRVLAHATGCEACTEARPRNVSAARVFSLLPAPALSPQARAELLDSLTTPPPSVPAPTGDSAAPAAEASAVTEPPAAAAAAALPPPVDLPLAALVQPPPSVTPLPSRRGRRTSLVIAGIGAVASAVVITSAFALAGSSRPAPAVREVTPTMMAGTATGTVPQAAGLGSAGSGPVASGNEAARLSRVQSRTQLPTPPPLAGTAGGRNQVLITAATQPLSPAQTTATRKGAAGQPAAPATSASPGTLQLSAGSVRVGVGTTGQITLTAIDGPVRWSASSSAPNQVSLSSTAGTLAAGQSATLTVTVTRVTPAGSATLTFDSSASASQLVQVIWTAPASGGAVSRPPRHPRPHPSPSASPTEPSPSPTSASPTDTMTPDPSGS
jgi:hypothetical protein